MFKVIFESVILTTVAGYFGLVFGIGITEMVAAAMKGAGGGSEFFKNPEVSLSVAATALAILIVSGAFAGLLPAKRAVSIKPVEAIQNE